MPNLKSLIKLLLLPLMIAVALLLGHSVSFGASFDIGDVDYESYLNRPSILDVTAKSDGIESWSGIKAAHFSFVAQLFATYPKDTEFYFLARDSEYLFDVAQLINSESNEFQKVHLLNISRANMRDPLVKEYLAENGIDNSALEKGKKIVFVDTGFAGTIPRVISELFPEHTDQLQTHLIASSEPRHPSSRSFLFHLNPEINKALPANMHISIVGYEHMAHYTSRAIRFVRIGSKIHPVNSVFDKTDGRVSKGDAVSYMQDLKYEWSLPERKKKFFSEYNSFLEIKKMMELPTEEAAKKLTALMDEETNLDKRKQLEARIRDLIDARVNTDSGGNITLADLDLTDPKLTQKKNYKNKNDIVEKFPKYAKYIENPESAIPKLFKSKDWTTLKEIIALNIDADISSIIVQNLFTGNEFPEKASLQKYFIDFADDKNIDILISDIFAKPGSQSMFDLINYIIEKHDKNWTLYSLAWYVFDKPHAKSLKPLLAKLIARGNQDLLKVLAKYTFRAPHTGEWVDLLQQILENIKIVNQDVANEVFYAVKASPTQTFAHAILRASISIPDGERKDWIKTRLAASKGKFYDPKKEFWDDAVNNQLKVDNLILLDGYVYKIIEKLNQGYDYTELKVQAENGAYWALKLFDYEKVNYAKAQISDLIKKEKGRSQQLQTLKIPHAKIKTSFGVTLRPLIPGLSGSEVISRYRSGDLTYKKAMDELKTMIQSLVQRKLYIAQLLPENMIWTGKHWVIMNSGDITQTTSVADAEALWKTKTGDNIHNLWVVDEASKQSFAERWGIDVSLSKVAQCMSLYSGPGK